MVKKWGFIVFLVFCAFGISSAQCTYMIPYNAILVQDSRFVEAPLTNYWVCEGGELTLKDGKGRVFVENGGKVSIRGHANWEVYAPGGAEVSIEAMGRVQVFASPQTLIDRPFGKLSSEILIMCPQVLGDYTAAPSHGCKTQIDPILGENLENYPSISINQDFLVIKHNTQRHANGQSYWLCGPQSMYHFGSKSKLVVESYGKLFLDRKGYNTIFLKQGAKLDLGQSRNNLVYYQDPKDILQPGEEGDNILIHMPLMDIIYDDAPKHGCISIK